MNYEDTLIAMLAPQEIIDAAKRLDKGEYIQWGTKAAERRKQDEDSRKIASLQLDVAKNYVTHADLSDIKDSLLRIEDKLDRKQDRDHSPRAK